MSPGRSKHISWGAEDATETLRAGLNSLNREAEREQFMAERYMKALNFYSPSLVGVFSFTCGEDERHDHGQSLIATEDAPLEMSRVTEALPIPAEIIVRDGSERIQNIHHGLDIQLRILPAKTELCDKPLMINVHEGDLKVINRDY